MFIDSVDPAVDFDVPVDLFAIGFEEIVDLNASNIMNTRSVTFQIKNSN